MIREVKFESQDRRIKQILAALNENGIKDIEEANAICDQYGLDPYKTCEDTQPICFENAKWAYVVGCAIALKKGCKTAADAAEAIGIGLQAFCIPGSVADDRKVGLGHGNLAARLLREETKCFAFLAGHESFAAAEGAIKIAAKADKVRKEPLRCILNGLGKDAAQIISRINGFTYVQTQFDYYTGELKVVREIAYSNGPRAKVKCYGADDVREGVAIMWHEGVDVSITGNSTNPTRFQHPVAGTYKKERTLAYPCRQTVFLCCIRWRYRTYSAPGQYGCRPCLLRYDRHHGPYALRRTVCRFILSPCPRGDDGIPGNRQQPYGGMYCCLCCGCGNCPEQVIQNQQKG